MKSYETLIGLEVHIQLNTLTKAFCGDSILFGQDPNTQVSPVSLAHPGTLPVANKAQVEKAVMLGLALGCKINRLSFFDRKHYFYPDLPKAYQITQDAQPICVGGQLELEVDGKSRVIRIHHIHMEEDAGKSIHDKDPDFSFIDLNRAGTPLLELVTEPDLRSGEEVQAFIAELQNIVRFINVSDADMEKGSLRCDCNVSVRPFGADYLTERCEIKNLNSKKFARDAVEYESHRQAEMYKRGETFSRQTLHYDSDTGQTLVLREKEGADDYRYFPDPDIPPVRIRDDQFERIKKAMPKLPAQIKREWMEEYGFSRDYASQLCQSYPVYASFVSVLEKTKDPQSTANVYINQLLPLLNTGEESDMDPTNYEEVCIEYVKMIRDGKISASTASQKLWPLLAENPAASPLQLAEQAGLLLNEDQEYVDLFIESSLLENPSQLEAYRKGKKALFGFFMGDVMKRAGSGTDPQLLKKKLQEKLEKS